MAERVGIIAIGFAVLHATVTRWLGGFYGSGTRSFASAFVCAMVILISWVVLIAADKELAFSFLTKWPTESFVTLIIVFSIVDFAFVQTGKVDRWAKWAMQNQLTAWRYRNEATVALILVALGGLVWSFNAA